MCSGSFASPSISLFENFIFIGLDLFERAYECVVDRCFGFFNHSPGCAVNSTSYIYREKREILCSSRKLHDDT